MTAPMMPQVPQDPQAAPQPMQPPIPPSNPFPSRANDGEIAVATAYAKRLSKLFVDPQFETFDPLWQQTAIDCYNRAMQALQPPPVLPKGVVIQAKAGDPASIAADEQAAATGKAPQPQAPKIQTTGAAPSSPAPL